MYQDSGGVITGTVREASGEFGAWKALSDVKLVAPTLALQFGIPNGLDTSRFIGVMSCDSLYGTMQAYRTTEPTTEVLVRTLMGHPVARN